MLASRKPRTGNEKITKSKHYQRKQGYNFEKEMRMLIDICVLAKERTLRQGMEVCDLTLNENVVVTSLGDFQVGKEYVSLNGVHVAVYGSKITLKHGNNCGKVSINTACETVDEVDPYFLEGNFHYKSMKMALQNLTDCSLDKGIVLHVEGKPVGRPFFTLQDLLVNTTYHTVDEKILLRRVGLKGLINFKFHKCFFMRVRKNLEVLLDENSVPNIPPAPIPAPPPAPGVLASAKKKKLFKSLHWNSIPDNQVGDTFWGDKTFSPPQEGMKEDLMKLFALSPSVHNRKKAVEKVEVAEALLSVKTINNASILLTQFQISLDEIREGINIMDDSRFSVEQLISLNYLIPLSQHEENKMMDYSGNYEDLCLAEQFYYKMRDVSQIELKLKYFIFKKQFNDQIAEATKELKTISTAAQELVNSRLFALLLKWILKIGLVLNDSTYLQAKGFKLDSLPKLKDTKDNTNKITLLDFLTHTLIKECDEALDFVSDLPTLHKASRLSLALTMNSIEKIAQTIADLEQQITEEHFIECSRTFFMEAKQALHNITLLEESTLSTFHSTLQYFGHNEDHNSEEFFAYITTFESHLKNSQEILKTSTLLEEATV